MRIITSIMALLLLTGCVSVDTVMERESKETKTRNASNTVSLENKIGQMLMVGFLGTTAKQNSQICKDIQNYNLGGVILFDYNPIDRSKAKNISTKGQLANLTKELQSCTPDNRLLISVDQEGGRVQRLKSKYGFDGDFPKASEMTQKNKDEVRAIYERMGKELKTAGINFNLAPVVDLAINPENVVINKLGRSFGQNAEEVIAYTSVFMDAMHKNNVLTSLKHFPGHGSSLGDTHKGFVDVTKDWKSVELMPYKLLIQKDTIDTIMVAHVFNATIDERYPASLSNKTITQLLRKQMGYKGVVITDDLQMGAIDKKYGLKETLKLAINAGDDILLFGNQLNPRDRISTQKLVDIILDLVNHNEISVEKINRAYARIEQLKNRHF